MTTIAHRWQARQIGDVGEGSMLIWEALTTAPPHVEAERDEKWPGRFGYDDVFRDGGAFLLGEVYPDQGAWRLCAPWPFDGWDPPPSGAGDGHAMHPRRFQTPRLAMRAFDELLAAIDADDLWPPAKASGTAHVIGAHAWPKCKQGVPIKHGGLLLCVHLDADAAFRVFQKSIPVEAPGPDPEPVF